MHRENYSQVTRGLEGSVDVGKAFDAVESYLCESERDPSADWRTVSLVTALLGLISRGPEFEKPTPEARLKAFKAAADELSHRGVDATALVRYGMSREVTAPLLAALLVALIFRDQKGIEGVDVRGWCAALDLESPTFNSSPPAPQELGRWFEQVLVPVVPLMLRWAANASLDELITLTPPTPGTLYSCYSGEAVDRSLREQYRWAVDHFAKTFYRDWQTSSLHYELRWLDGDIVAPCSDYLMRDRNVLREDINQEIAKRVVYQGGQPDPGESLVAEMSRHAQTLLRQGRCMEAAAVFEFGVQQRPGDPDIRNNLGFCMIPVNAGEALAHLKAAVNLGYDASATNTYNQMCCYVSLGRFRAALNIADAESKNSNLSSRESLLWRRAGDGKWELFNSEDSYRSLAEFAAEIARIEGWKDQEAFWRSVANRLPKGR